MYTASRYTFAFPVETGILLYNANSGAVVSLSGLDAVALSKRLTTGAAAIDPGPLPVQLRDDLIAGGMLVESDVNELEQIRGRYLLARVSTPLALTITTTMDCNLGCYYCYEERSEARLSVKDIAAIVDLARQRLSSSGKRTLHVDWYGGEPTLNIEFLAHASLALQSLCEKLHVGYSASIISNGTSWPSDVGEFVKAHRLRQVQISFDGLKANHDKRRRYRRGRAPGIEASSFEMAISVVDRLLDYVRVDVRFNMDRGNVSDLPGFLAMMRERGWFSRRFPVVVQPARLAAYTDKSAFMRKTGLTSHEYDDLRKYTRDTVGDEIGVEESEAPDGFPYPRTSVCVALAHDSVVVGAEGSLYRCGLQVGDSARSVGSVHRGSRRELPVLSVAHDDNEWWSNFDPTRQPKCAKCSFLPICWSGCPKKHLEGDTYAIDEQGAYWRANLARLVSNGVQMRLSSTFVLGLEDQFRD